MALKAKLATLDGLESATAALYKKAGTVFVLDVEPVEGVALEDVSALKATVGTLRKELGDAQAAAKPFEGLDAADVRKLLDKRKEIDAWKPDAKTEEIVSARVQSVTEKFTKEIGDKDTALSAAGKQIEELLVNGELSKAIAEHKGIPALLEPLARQFIRTQRTSDGKVKVVVVDSEGKPRTTNKAGSADEMGIGEFISGLKSDENYAGAFLGSGASGGGAAGGGSRGATGVRLIDAKDAGKYVKEIAAGSVQVREDVQ